MATNQPSNERELEQQLKRATSSQPLDASLHDLETHELRAGWNALKATLESSHAANERPFDMDALWNHAQQPEVTPLGRHAATSSSTAWIKNKLIVLAATAATLALVVMGLWQWMGSATDRTMPQVVVEEPATVPLEVTTPASSPEPMAPEPPAIEQIVQEEPTAVEPALPEEIANENALTTEEDLYAWDDGFDDSVTSASSAMHDIRYGWRNTSESYRYISTQLESFEESMSSEDL